MSSATVTPKALAKRLRVLSRGSYPPASILVRVATATPDSFLRLRKLTPFRFRIVRNRVIGNVLIYEYTSSRSINRNWLYALANDPTIKFFPIELG